MTDWIKHDSENPPEDAARIATDYADALPAELEKPLNNEVQ